MNTTPDAPAGIGDWLQRLPEPARRALPVAIGLVVLFAAWIASRGRTADAVLPLNRDVLPAAALAHLHERGLRDARLDEHGNLRAPADRLVEARRWLAELDSSASTWADEWEKSNSQLGQFSGNRERDAAREITRAKMIGRLLRQMPGILQADVIWDEEEAAGWRQPQKTRCTVYLRPRPGSEITPDVAQAVRQAVAGSKKNLAPGDIVVMDLDRMRSFGAVPAGVDESRRILAERQTADIQRDIESALRPVKGVRVSVAVSWRPPLAEEPLVSLSPVAHGGPNQRMSLVSNRLSPAAEFDLDELDAHSPRFDITVSAPEDEAERWAVEHEADDDDSSESDSENGVIQASFRRRDAGRSGRTPASTAAAIRRTVESVMGRYNRESVPAAIAVHLAPTTKTSKAVLADLPAPATIDPFFFLGGALGACLLGAWVLSRAFQRSVPALEDAAPGSAEWQTAAAWTGIPESVALAPETPPPTGCSHDALEFEDLIQLSDDAWRTLFPECPPDVWSCALRGASQQLRRAALNGLEEPERAALTQALDAGASPRLGDIEAAQQRILLSARLLLSDA
ncbi:MAG: hypothetical protein KF774_09060 [Planctomyces sp.]|nr:hypothetical protein [Planctomyces sp.]